MIAVVLLVSAAGSHALPVSQATQLLMLRTQEQMTMKTRGTNITRLQGHGVHPIAAGDIHKNLVNMEVSSYASTFRSQTAAKKVGKDHAYMEIPFSGPSGEASSATPLEGKTSLSHPLQKITRFATLVHHVRKDPDLINDLAKSAGIETLGWTADQLHAAAHAVHERVVGRTGSLLQTKTKIQIQLEQFHDDVNRMRQHARLAPGGYIQNLSANTNSSPARSMRQQIEEMHKQLDRIRGNSKSDAQSNVNDSKRHQQFDDIHQELDALRFTQQKELDALHDEINLLRSNFQEEITVLRNKVDQDHLGRELHEFSDTSLLRGRINISDSGTGRDFGSLDHSAKNLPWANMETGLTKSMKALKTQDTTLGVYFSVATIMTSFIGKAASGESIGAEDVVNLCAGTLPQLLFLANPVLGAAVGMAFSFFKSVFFPGPSFVTEEKLKEQLEFMRQKIMTDVEKLIARTTLENKFSEVTNTLEDLMEEMYWVTQMLEEEQAMVENHRFDESAKMAQLTYQLMLQHQLSMMKRDMFHTECWDHNEGQLCRDWQEQSGGFLVSWHFVSVHLNVLLEICKLQPAYTAAVLGRVKHIGGVYMDHLERSFRVYKEKRMTYIEPLETDPESCWTTSGSGTCTLRGGYDKQTERRTWQVSDLWGAAADQVKVNGRPATEQNLPSESEKSDTSARPAVVLENCCNCGCSREHCDAVMRTFAHVCKIKVFDYCQDEPGQCVAKFEGEHMTHYQDITAQLDGYQNIINEIRRGLSNIPDDFSNGALGRVPAPAPTAQGGQAGGWSPAPPTCVMTWAVDGNCFATENCVTTPYWPNMWYPTNFQCTMRPQCECACHVSSDDFKTEGGYDILTISGQQFSGEVQIPLTETQGSALVFNSDGTVSDRGFKLCLHAVG